MICIFFHTSLNIRNNSNKMRGLPNKCYPRKDSWLSLAWWHFVGDLTAKIHPCTFICCLVRMEKLASFVAISGFFYRFALARILELCWPVGGKIVHLLLTHGLEHVFNASLSFLGASNVWMLIWMFKAQMIHLWHLFFRCFLGICLFESPTNPRNRSQGSDIERVVQKRVSCWRGPMWSYVGLVVPYWEWPSHESLEIIVKATPQFIASSSQLQWAKYLTPSVTISQ